MINKGIRRGDDYVKTVRFSKAVLWKIRSISLPPAVMERIMLFKLKNIIFEDLVKKERWTAPVERVKEVMVLRQEGQEPQYYIPVSVFEKEPMS